MGSGLGSGLGLGVRVNLHEEGVSVSKVLERQPCELELLIPHEVDATHLVRGRGRGRGRVRVKGEGEGWGWG